MEHGLGASWIYLLFFAPFLLAMLRPIFRKLRGQSRTPYDVSSNRPENFDDEFRHTDTQQDTQQTSYTEQESDTSYKPPSLEALVLDELHHGTRTFEKLQKNLGLEAGELDTILEGLEEKGKLEVRHKQGLFGSKIELYPI